MNHPAILSLEESRLGTASKNDIGEISNFNFTFCSIGEISGTIGLQQEPYLNQGLGYIISAGKSTL